MYSILTSFYIYIYIYVCIYVYIYILCICSYKINKYIYIYIYVYVLDHNLNIHSRQLLSAAGFRLPSSRCRYQLDFGSQVGNCFSRLDFGLSPLACWQLPLSAGFCSSLLVFGRCRICLVGICRPTPFVQRPTSYALRPTSYVLCPTSYVLHPAISAGFRLLSAGLSGMPPPITQRLESMMDFGSPPLRKHDTRTRPNTTELDTSSFHSQ